MLWSQRTPEAMSQISLCSVCSGMAVIAVLKDPFGKSDEMVNYCATHAPPVQWPHASIVAAFRGDQEPHCATCKCYETTVRPDHE